MIDFTTTNENIKNQVPSKRILFLFVKYLTYKNLINCLLLNLKSPIRMNKITCTILKRQEIKRILNKPHFAIKYAA